MKVEIDIDRIIHNAKVLQSHTKANFCAVVKDNAYGHGLNICEQLQHIVDCFAVVNVQEAVELRQYVQDKDIINLGIFERENASLLFEYKIIPTINYLSDLIELDNIAKQLNKKIGISIEVNSGFNRNGISPKDCGKFASILEQSTNIKLHGVFTHFCDYTDKSYTKFQHNIFVKCIKPFAKFNPIVHCVSSYGIGMPEYHHDMVRCGIGLYGFGHKDLKQAMAITSKIIAVNHVPKGNHISYGTTKTTKDTMVATVKGGYGQGLIREVYKQAIVDNTLCNIIGNITMDYFMLDITELCDKHANDKYFNTNNTINDTINSNKNKNKFTNISNIKNAVNNNQSQNNSQITLCNNILNANQNQEIANNFVGKIVIISDDVLKLDQIATNANTIPWQLMTSIKG